MLRGRESYCFKDAVFLYGMVKNEKVLEIESGDNYTIL